MNAKSKFTIPILQGTRPEVGLFSATVAAPSLRNASSLVSGVAVSSYPLVTTSVTNNNAIPPYVATENGVFNLQGNNGLRVCYPGTNAELVDTNSSNLLYLNSSKKTIQLDNSQDVTGEDISDAMVTYLKTGKIEGNIDSVFDVAGVFATATNTAGLGESIDGYPMAELFDCSPTFNNVSGLALTDAGSNYQVSTFKSRLVYFVNKNGVTVVHPTAYVLADVTSIGSITTIGTIDGQVLIDFSIENIPIGAKLTIEDGQVENAPTLLSGGSNYDPGAIVNFATELVVQGPNSSSLSNKIGQGLQILAATDGGGAVLAAGLAITDRGSGYSSGDIVRLIAIDGAGVPTGVGDNNALLQVVADKNPTINNTLATVVVDKQYRPGSGAPLVPYDSYTVESIKLPNGQIKPLALDSEENICQSKVPKTRIFTAGGQLAYYPQISSGLNPTNWIVGNGAALCANPTLCLPVNVRN